MLFGRNCSSFTTPTDLQQRSLTVAALLYLNVMLISDLSSSLQQLPTFNLTWLGVFSLSPFLPISPHPSCCFSILFLNVFIREKTKKKLKRKKDAMSGKNITFTNRIRKKRKQNDCERKIIFTLGRKVK